MYEGVDVSKHQGIIDWKKVKESGKTFAIIRVGWTHYEGGLTLDPLYPANVMGAKNAGLAVGAYVYSYDRSAGAAKKSAQALIEALAPYDFDYPIAFDIEDQYNTTLSKDTNNSIVEAFMTVLEQAGYYGILYTYTYFANGYLNMDKLTKYDVWIADYRAKCGFTGKYGIWQYKGEEGRCSGVKGACDLNISYKDYSTIIRRAGLNHLEDKPAEPEVDYKALYFGLLDDIRNLMTTYDK